MPIENKNYSAKELDDILSQYDIQVDDKSNKRKKFTDKYAEIDDDPEESDIEHDGAD